MLNEDYDYLFKLVLVGDSGVGKSNLLGRYIKNEFKQDTKTTIGVEFASKDLRFDNKIVKAQIWDTAGQERYRAISAAYYRNSSVALIIYDITKHQTFLNIDKWIQELEISCADPDLIICIIGNKSDLSHLRTVSIEEGKSFAEKKKAYFFETSALNSDNVNTAFDLMVQYIYDIKKKKDILLPTSENIVPILPKININLRRYETQPKRTEKKCCN